jgi:hypothetical protein
MAVWCARKVQGAISPQLGHREYENQPVPGMANSSEMMNRKESSLSYSVFRPVSTSREHLIFHLGPQTKMKGSLATTAKGAD